MRSFAWSAARSFARLMFPAWRFLLFESASRARVLSAVNAAASPTTVVMVTVIFVFFITIVIVVCEG